MLSLGKGYTGLEKAPGLLDALLPPGL